MQWWGDERLGSFASYFRYGLGQNELNKNLVITDTECHFRLQIFLAHKIFEERVS